MAGERNDATAIQPASPPCQGFTETLVFNAEAQEGIGV
jgi:hypothetical protein